MIFQKCEKSQKWEHGKEWMQATNAYELTALELAQGSQLLEKKKKSSFPVSIISSNSAVKMVFFFFGWCCVSSYCLCSLVSWELLGSVNWVNLFDVLVFLLLPVSVVEFHSFFGKLFLKMLASIIILESQYAARK